MEYLSIEHSGEHRKLTVLEENHQVKSEFRCLFVFTTVKTLKEKQSLTLKQRRDSFISAFY